MIIILPDMLPKAKNFFLRGGAQTIACSCLGVSGACSPGILDSESARGILLASDCILIL